MTQYTLAPQMAELCAECFIGCCQQIELGFFVPINLVVSASVSRVKCVLQTASVLWAVSDSTHLLFSVDCCWSCRGCVWREPFTPPQQVMCELHKLH